MRLGRSKIFKMDRRFSQCRVLRKVSGPRSKCISRRCQRTLQHWRGISPTGEYRQYKGSEILSRRCFVIRIERTIIFKVFASEKSQLSSWCASLIIMAWSGAALSPLPLFPASAMPPAAPLPRVCCPISKFASFQAPWKSRMSRSEEWRNVVGVE
jgi:hypothetical protein